jgi:hypothetical protein
VIVALSSYRALIVLIDVATKPGRKSWNIVFSAFQLHRPLDNYSITDSSFRFSARCLLSLSHITTDATVGCKSRSL